MTDQDRLAGDDEPHAEQGEEPVSGQPDGGPGEPPAQPAGPGSAAPHQYQPVGPQRREKPPAYRRYTPAEPLQQPSSQQPGSQRSGSQPPGWHPPGIWQPGPWQQQVPWQQQGQWQQPGPVQAAGPQPLWSWRRSLAGVLVGFAPEALLTLAAYASGTASGSSPTQVSVSTGIVLLVSSLVFYGWQLFAAWLFSLRGVARTLWQLGYRRPTAAYFWVVPLVLAASYAVIIANDVVLHPPQQDIVQSFPKSAAGIVMFTLLAVVMAPLAEETFFRGFVFRGFAQSWGFLAGAAVSGAIFSLAHLQLTLFLPLFALGFGLAWAYKRTGSLWTNITIHAIFNGISVLAWALS